MSELASVQSRKDQAAGQGPTVNMKTYIQAILSPKRVVVFLFCLFKKKKIVKCVNLQNRNEFLSVNLWLERELNYVKIIVALRAHITTQGKKKIH